MMRTPHNLNATLKTCTLEALSALKGGPRNMVNNTNSLFLALFPSKTIDSIR